MSIKNKIKYFFSKFWWLKVYFSPFEPIKPRFYIGKVAIGTPYFFPRKWVKATPELAHKAVLEYIKNEESFNKLNPTHARKIKTYEEIYQQKLKYEFAITKKIGFDFVDLGWKTKWSNTDIRYEWSPVWSFVFFKWQIALIFVPEHADHYWECWLIYEKHTDKSKSKIERIRQAKKIFPCIWTSHYKDKTETICYWDLILKDKYLWQIID